MAAEMFFPMIRVAGSSGVERPVVTEGQLTDVSFDQIYIAMEGVGAAAYPKQQPSPARLPSQLVLDEENIEPGGSVAGGATPDVISEGSADRLELRLQGALIPREDFAAAQVAEPGSDTTDDPRRYSDPDDSLLVVPVVVLRTLTVDAGRQIVRSDDCMERAPLKQPGTIVATDTFGGALTRYGPVVPSEAPVVGEEPGVDAMSSEMPMDSPVMLLPAEKAEVIAHAAAAAVRRDGVSPINAFVSEKTTLRPSVAVPAWPKGNDAPVADDFRDTDLVAVVKYPLAGPEGVAPINPAHKAAAGAVPDSAKAVEQSVVSAPASEYGPAENFRMEKPASDMAFKPQPTPPTQTSTQGDGDRRLLDDGGKGSPLFRADALVAQNVVSSRPAQPAYDGIGLKALPQPLERLPAIQQVVQQPAPAEFSADRPENISTIATQVVRVRHQDPVHEQAFATIEHKVNMEGAQRGVSMLTSSMSHTVQPLELTYLPATTPDIVALQSRPTPVPEFAAASNTLPVPSRSLGEQIAAGVQAARHGMIEMRLSPEELGNIRVIIHSDTQALRIVVESPETLGLIQRHADQLIRELRQEGVDNPRVAFEQGRDFGSGGSSSNRNFNDEGRSWPQQTPLRASDQETEPGPQPLSGSVQARTMTAGLDIRY